MLIKICKCGRRLRQGELCQCQKNRHKVYNAEHRDKATNDFYHSKAWSKASRAVKTRACGLDEYALIFDNQIVMGEIAHHIYEIDEAPTMRLSMDNLIFVSRRTHAKIHAAYSAGEESKATMQRRLMAIRRGDTEKVLLQQQPSARTPF